MHFWERGSCQFGVHTTGTLTHDRYGDPTITRATNCMVVMHRRFACLLIFTSGSVFSCTCIMNVGQGAFVKAIRYRRQHLGRTNRCQVIK